jgi:hypothetical protein
LRCLATTAACCTIDEGSPAICMTHTYAWQCTGTKVAAK